MPRPAGHAEPSEGAAWVNWGCFSPARSWRHGFYPRVVLQGSDWNWQTWRSDWNWQTQRLISTPRRESVRVA